MTAARALRLNSAPDFPILREGDPVMGDDTNDGLSSLVEVEAHSPEFPLRNSHGRSVDAEGEAVDDFWASDRCIC